MQYAYLSIWLVIFEIEKSINLKQYAVDIMTLINIGMNRILYQSFRIELQIRLSSVKLVLKYLIETKI